MRPATHLAPLPRPCRPAAFPFFYIEPLQMKKIIDRFNPKGVAIEDFPPIGACLAAPPVPACWLRQGRAWALRG